MKEDPPPTKAELLLHLSKEVSRIAGSLAQLSIGAGPLPRRDSPFCNQNGLDVPPERVDWLIKARRARADYLTRELFSDPAWDILLELLRQLREPMEQRRHGPRRHYGIGITNGIRQAADRSLRSQKRRFPHGRAGAV